MDLSVIWDVWGDSSGYVFIPRALRSASTRKKGYKWDEGPAFEWPEQQEAIDARIRLSAEAGWDVYWCPHVYSKPRRNPKEDPSVIRDTQRWVYSDLDTADPKLVKPEPTILVESSEGHWQALWRLSKDVPVADIETINRTIAYRYASIGADKSGWDLGQVLRVPGTQNHKYATPFDVKLVHHRKGAHEPTAFGEVAKSDTAEPVGIETAEDVGDLLKGYKLSIRAKELVYAKVAMGDRSERLWELAKLLVEAGVPIMVAAKVLKLSVWNKYAGRADEDRRIMTDVLKAEKEFKEDHTKVVELDTPTVAGDAPLWPVPYFQFLGSRMQDPEWLVESIWQRGAYGLIAGEPKTYKSVIATDLMLSVASGRPFLGVFPVKQRGPVMYLQEENPDPTVKDRIVKIAHQKGLLPTTLDELPPNLPFHLSSNVGFDISDPEHRQQLEDAVRRLGIILLVLDPIYMMLGGVDENSNTELRPILTFLTSLRNKYGCGTMLLHHFRKQQHGAGRVRGGQRTSGGSIFHRWVDCAIYTELIPDGIRVEREFRSFPKQPDLKISFTMGDPGTLLYVPEVLADEGGTTAADIKKEELISVLIDAGVGGIKFDDIMARMKVQRPKLQQWIRELKDEGLLTTERHGKGTVYKITDEGRKGHIERMEEESV